MTHVIESRLLMADRTELFIRDWLIDNHTNDNPQPCIVILHGLSEHCGRYDHIAQFLNSCGFSVRTYDHRGHGQSGGARGDTPNPMALVNDAELMIHDFAQRCRTRPILFGHSMGGLFAARIATAGTVSISGLILSSPALAFRLRRPDRFLLKLISSIAPHFAISFRIKPDYLSHKLATVVAYLNDPLVHKKITPNLLNSMLSAIDYVQTHAPVLSVPTLLLVAEEDRVVDPQGSRDFFEVLPSNLGTAHFYPDFYHEIFNEVDADKVFHDLQNWLAARHLR